MVFSQNLALILVTQFSFCCLNINYLLISHLYFFTKFSFNNIVVYSLIEKNNVFIVSFRGLTTGGGSKEEHNN